MTAYLPIIISGILIFTALMWWILALGNVKKGASKTEIVLPKAVPAPPVAAAPALAKLMDDPAPASKTAPPKAQAPLKAGATKAAPTKTTKPATQKAAAPKAPAARASVKNTEVPKAAPVASKPKAASAPKAKAAHKAASKPVIPDNLLLLKGVGPKLNTLLQSLGITRFAQVANWSSADIAEIDAKLGTFAGRIGRDNWVDQAKLLVAGDVVGFEKKYGSLGSEVPKG